MYPIEAKLLSEDETWSQTLIFFVLHFFDVLLQCLYHMKRTDSVLDLT
jgi:hypothetical protein